MYKVEVRVVETMLSGKGGFFDSEQFQTLQDIAEWAAERMLYMGAGGVTVDAPSVGMWRNGKGEIVKEVGQQVWTYTDTPASFIRLASELKTIGNQDCVLFSVSEMKEVMFV